ncbi:MAG: prenyltransferase/squalene oxidase repeat-containing protein [Acidobacteriota bacterium]
MLQVARLASRLLGEATDNVRRYLSTQTVEGGFRDRNGQRDLYYTVFGLDAVAILDTNDSELTGWQPDRAATLAFFESFDAGAGLDLVHLGCLARVWTALGLDAPPPDPLVDRLLDLRRDDGGWAMTENDDASTSYGTFVGIGAYQDLGLPIGQPSRAVDFLTTMALDHGGYALDANTRVATTPTTAAAVVALRQLGGTAHPNTATWLERQHHRMGGFLAAEGAPMPDLLSTAVALHALSVLEARCDHLREPLLDFVDTLWTSTGGFYGNWAEQEIDTEYTFYGLLALGHLAVMDGGS